MMKVEKLIFQIHGDERGQLVSLEEEKNIPFPVKRVYYMYDTKKGVRRGFHSHKTLQQILICIHGSCYIHLDNGIETEEVLLDKPYEGIYISSNIWREMYEFSDDAVLMVLASDVYHEEDYIRDYNAFIDQIEKCKSLGAD